MKNNNEIGERVKKARKFLELTQAEFSSKLGVSRSHISNIENGNEFPSHSVILLMSAIFPIDLDWLQSGTGQMISNENKEELQKNKNDFENVINELKDVFNKDCPYWLQDEYSNLVKFFKDLLEACLKNNNDNRIFVSEIIYSLSCMLNSDIVEEYRRHKYKIIADLDDIIIENMQQ